MDQQQQPTICCAGDSYIRLCSVEGRPPIRSAQSRRISYIRVLVTPSCGHSTHKMPKRLAARRCNSKEVIETTTTTTTSNRVVLCIINWICACALSKVTVKANLAGMRPSFEFSFEKAFRRLFVSHHSCWIDNLLRNHPAIGCWRCRTYEKVLNGHFIGLRDAVEHANYVHLGFEMCHSYSLAIMAHKYCYLVEWLLLGMLNIRL